VKEVADLAIAKAKSAPQVPELRWSAFLGEAESPKKASKPAKPKQVKKKAAREGKKVKA
jgi:hypothetical protein